jgi:hypothetical protein
MKKKHKQRERESVLEEVWQDDSFYYIAGYTSSGAPYGVTWEEMESETDNEVDEDEAFTDNHADKQMEWLNNYMAALEEMEE